MERVILLYFAAVTLVCGRPDLDNPTSSMSTRSNDNKSPTPKRETPDKVTLQPDIPTTFPVKSGCFSSGKWYPPGSEISRGFDGKSWCYGTYCDQFGQVLVWDNFHCSTTTTYFPTTTPTPTTAAPTTTIPTTPPGCYYNGRWFPPGSEISRGSTYGWCYGTYCDAQGSIVAWDDWSCSTTARPTTIPSTPSYPTTEPPRGCNFQGRSYNLGSEISQYTGNSGERCHGRRCSDDGQIITWLGFNCQSGSKQRDGCWYRGHLYRHGMDIFRKQPSLVRCFKGSCEKNAALIKWKPLSCKEERPFLAGQRHMCSYRGKWYPRGSIIYSRSLYKTHGLGWCVGAKCGRNRRITTWGPLWLPGYC